MADTANLSADEQRLAELGYKQELNRTWSGFSNFAISFSIISILAGCFTTFAVGWNNGGPMAIALGLAAHLDLHPHHRLLHVGARVGLPDLGRHLLVGVQARRCPRPASTPAGSTCRSRRDRGVGRLRLRDVLRPDARHVQRSRGRTATRSRASSSSSSVVLVLVSLVNIFSSHLLAIFNNISVWWHVAGATVVVLILVFVPDHHQSVSDVFTDTREQHRVLRRRDDRARASSSTCSRSASSSPSTRSPATTPRPTSPRRRTTPPTRRPRASGARSSTRPSVAGSCCSSFLFAVQSVDDVTAAGGGVVSIFTQALSTTGRAPSWPSRRSGSSSARSPA